jgi:hypothetical protein
MKLLMKFIIILILIIILFVNKVNAQVNYFNNRYESITNIWNSGLSIAELSDGYVIGGTTGHQQNEFWHQISLIKLDVFGNELYEFIIGDEEAERDLSSGSLIVDYDNNCIFFTGSHRVYTTNWVHDQCMLIKLNMDLDLIWAKYYGEYSEPYDTSYLARNLAKFENNGFAIVGVKLPYALKSKIFFIKIDDTGEKEWESNYGTDSFYNQGFSVIQTTDGGYAIGGYRFLIGPSQVDADPIIYKTDSLGNLEWEKNIGGPFDDYYPVLTLGKDGNIVVGTCYADSMSNPTSAYRRINIVKMDNEGNIQWNKKYGESITYNYSKQIRTLEDGSYIIAGGVKNNYPHRSGWIFKVSSEGDSLWYRQYDNLFGSDSRNYLYDIIPTSDNGFAACGYVIPYSPDTGSQDAWVLKVDSMGCDTAGCITVNSEELMVNGEQGLRIWPNPANDMFWIKPYAPPLVPPNGGKSSHAVQPGGGKPARIVVYNSQGIKAKEVLVREGEEAVKVNVRGWQRGIYYVRMSVGGRNLGSGKVVVE